MIIDNNNKIEHALDITSLTSEGSGVGRLDNLVVFVEGAVPGDRIVAEIIQKNKSYSIGKMLKIVEPSKNRTEPLCEIFGRCGGCEFQQMTYQAQCEWKENIVFEAMNRIGGFQRGFLDTVISTILTMSNPYNYRNNVQLSFAGTSQSPKIGFYEHDSHTVADMHGCRIQPPVANAISEMMREFIKSKDLTIYRENSKKTSNEPLGSGLMRHLAIRIGFHTKQIMVIIVISESIDVFDNEFIELLKSEVEKSGLTLSSLYININGNTTNIVFGKKFKLIYGSEYIEEKLGNIKYRISPCSFFQVNTLQAEVMNDKIIEFADLSPNDTAIDLYCGSGAISLALAGHCKKVIGVEIIEQSITDARKNAHVNDIHNAVFYTGKAQETFPQMMAEEINAINADLLVIDPPRKGLDLGLPEFIAKTAIPKIIYVSCNPATLARDCKCICEKGGYEIMSIQPIDMFPWSAHVETVVLIKNLKSKNPCKHCISR